MTRTRRATTLAAFAGVALTTWGCDHGPLHPLSLRDQPHATESTKRSHTLGDDEAQPRITVSIDGFSYTFPPGTVSDPPPPYVLELPEHTWITIGWRAEPSAGEAIVKTRISVVPFGEPVPHHAEWMRWLGQHTKVLESLVGGGARTLYIEVEDSAGRSSIAILHLSYIVSYLQRPLLIVNDTRLLPDQRSPSGSLLPPVGPWPTAAELDTFLFAVGGFPWMGYPAGTLSTPGLFAGYEHDTLGTRSRTPVAAVPLAVLMRYDHVIWILDADAAENDELGAGADRLITALRTMTRRGASNTLAEYVERGGRLWLLGGGAARATLLDWQHPSGGPEFCYDEHELIPGRMMYDQVHWRSCLNVSSGATTARLVRSPRSSGHWSALFPTELVRKTTDPVPPLRTPAQFYRSFFWYEYLAAPNTILERVEVGSPIVLDTLYQTVGGTVPPGAIRPSMTLYNGRENGQVIFSGFDLWSFRRSDVQQLVDAVLGRVWSMPQQLPARGAGVSAGDPAALAAPPSRLATRRR